MNIGADSSSTLSISLAGKTFGVQNDSTYVPTDGNGNDCPAHTPNANPKINSNILSVIVSCMYRAFLLKSGFQPSDYDSPLYTFGDICPQPSNTMFVIVVF